LPVVNKCRVRLDDMRLVVEYIRNQGIQGKVGIISASQLAYSNVLFAK
jgi:hypothetical protein